MKERTIRVWDLPTRAFHWLLLILVVAAYLTGLQGGNLIVWHGRLGVLIAGLLAFRLTWGVVGSTYARFAHFVRGPAAIVVYLRGQWREPGHNPLGAVSVLVLLGILGFQVVSGLLSSDDIAFNGPLYPLVAKATSDRLTGLHSLNIWLIGALVALHLAAVIYYVRVKGDDIVKPMLTGRKRAAHPAQRSASGGGLVAFIAALAVAGTTMWAAAGGLLPSPPAPPPSAPAPAW